MPLRLEVLARLPLFANLTAHELGDIIGVLQDGTAHPGEVLIAEGAPPPTPLHILLEGAAATVKHGADGRSNVVGMLHAPSIFGEMDILAQRPALAGVVAVEASHFATLSGDAVGALCDAARPSILKVLNNLATALRYRSHASELRLHATPPHSGHTVGPARNVLYSGWDTRRR